MSTPYTPLIPLLLLHHHHVPAPEKTNKQKLAYVLTCLFLLHRPDLAERARRRAGRCRPWLVNSVLQVGAPAVPAAERVEVEVERVRVREGEERPAECWSAAGPEGGEEECAAECRRAAERVVGVRPVWQAREERVRRVRRVLEEVALGEEARRWFGGCCAGWSRLPRPVASDTRARPRVHVPGRVFGGGGVKPRVVRDLQGRRFLRGEAVGQSRVTIVTRAPGEAMPWIPRRRQRGVGFGVCVPPRHMWGVWGEEEQGVRRGEEERASSSDFALPRCPTVVVRRWEELGVVQEAPRREERVRKGAEVTRELMGRLAALKAAKGLR